MCNESVPGIPCGKINCNNKLHHVSKNEYDAEYCNSVFSTSFSPLTRCFKYSMMDMNGINVGICKEKIMIKNKNKKM